MGWSILRFESKRGVSVCFGRRKIAGRKDGRLCKLVNAIFSICGKRIQKLPSLAVGGFESTEPVDITQRQSLPSELLQDLWLTFMLQLRAREEKQRITQTVLKKRFDGSSIGRSRLSIT